MAAQGLKDLWSIKDASQGSSDKAAKKLREQFDRQMALVNANLQVAVANAEAEKHAKAAAKREKAYEKYNKSLQKLDPKDPQQAEQIAKEVLDYAANVQKESEQLKEDTEKAKQAWEAQASEFERVRGQIEDLDRAGNEEAPKLLEVTRQIDDAVSANLWKVALDAFFPRLPDWLNEQSKKAENLGPATSETFQEFMSPGDTTETEHGKLLGKNVRHATFPLDCEAHEAANRRIREKLSEEGDPNPGRRLKMDGSDDADRKMWMDKYIEAGGEAVSEAQYRKPGEPVTTCAAQLTVVVGDVTTERPVPGATVNVVGDGNTLVKTTTDRGIVEFPGVAPGRYQLHVITPGYQLFNREIVLPVNQETIETVRLQSMATTLIVIVTEEVDGNQVGKQATIRITPEGHQWPSGHRRKKTDRRGRLVLRDIPPGRYDIEGWSEIGKTDSSSADVRPSSTTVARIDLSHSEIRNPCCALKYEIAYYSALLDAWSYSSGGAGGFKDKGEARYATVDREVFISSLKRNGFSNERAWHLYEFGDMVRIPLEHARGATTYINRRLRAAYGPGGLKELKAQLKRNDCINDEHHPICKKHRFRFK